MLEIIALPLLTMITCKVTKAVIILLIKGFTGKDIALKSSIYQIIKNFKEEGSTVKKASGSPKMSSKH